VSGDRNADSDASFEVERTEGAKKPVDFSSSSDSKRHDVVGLVVVFLAGSCRLRKACGKLGLRALPIDKDPKRAESCVVENYDLTDPQQYSTLVEVLHAEKDFLVHAHCAPSCGTASRARGRKVHGMPSHLQPQPLRSDDHPDGLPALSENGKARVESANASYKATADLLSMLIQWKVSVSIENPSKSLFWKPSWIQKLLEMVPNADAHDTFFGPLHAWRIR